MLLSYINHSENQQRFQTASKVDRNKLTIQ